VLEGEFTVWSRKNKVVLKAGESFLISISTPHVVAALVDQPTRGLIVAVPSAFARLIEAAGTQNANGPWLQLTVSLASSVSTP
jgi:quercetin dioxygenase-like cupin family protein